MSEQVKIDKSKELKGVLGQPVQTGLDWQAYFLEFSEAHGGNPIVHGGKFLFEDGWMYSSTDHAGPEWEPPSNPRELNVLLRTYWLRRRAIVSYEQIELQREIEHLENMQAQRKVPLQQFQRFLDMEAKRWSRTVGPLDTEAMTGRLEWLTDDLKHCDDKLTELAEELLTLDRSGR